MSRVRLERKMLDQHDRPDHDRESRQGKRAATPIPPRDQVVGDAVAEVLLLTTECMVADKPDEGKGAAGGMPPGGMM